MREYCVTFLAYSAWHKQDIQYTYYLLGKSDADAMGQLRQWFTTYTVLSCQPTNRNVLAS
jgi:hypothetical protein